MQSTIFRALDFFPHYLTEYLFPPPKFLARLDVAYEALGSVINHPISFYVAPCFFQGPPVSLLRDVEYVLRSQGHIIPQLLAHPHGSPKTLVCHHQFSVYHLSATGAPHQQSGESSKGHINYKKCALCNFRKSCHWVLAGETTNRIMLVSALPHHPNACICLL